MRSQKQYIVFFLGLFPYCHSHWTLWEGLGPITAAGKISGEPKGHGSYRIQKL